jgi:hypothetical protein
MRMYWADFESITRLVVFYLRDTRGYRVAVTYSLAPLRRPAAATLYLENGA